MPDMETMLEKPETYGFKWGTQPVASGGNRDEDKTVVGQAPRIVPFDVALFDKSFPGKILEAANGTSIPVSCDSITRRMLLNDRKTPFETMQRRLIAWLLKLKVAATPPKAKVDQELWDSLNEAQRSKMLRLNPQGISLIDQQPFSDPIVETLAEVLTD